MKSIPKVTDSVMTHKILLWFARPMTWFAVNLFAFLGLLIFHFALAPPTNKWWPDAFAITTNLLTGGLVSFLFYYLVVHLPEARKKTIIKENFQKKYKDIKTDILMAVVQASKKGGRHDLEASFEFVESLSSPKIFKKTFENGSEGDEGFYAFQNQMNRETPEFHQIVRNLTFLSKEIEFILQNYSINDPKIFSFFKGLELFLINLRADGAGYDESKPLCKFIWEIFAGWDWLDGDIGHDKIQKMIDNL